MRGKIKIFILFSGTLLICIPFISFYGLVGLNVYLPRSAVKMGLRIADTLVNTTNHRINNSSRKVLQNGDSTLPFAKTHFMTINPRARTGNQMFQVAMLLATARLHGYTPVIRPSCILKNWFNIPFVSNITLSNIQTFKEAKGKKYDHRITNLSHSSNWTFGNFFQSWRYFQDDEELVRKAFTFKEAIWKQAEAYMKNKFDADIPKVCVHIRQGDFRGKKDGHSVAPVRYIRDAMRHFRNKHTHVQFIAMSDSPGWCKTNLNWDNLTFSPIRSPGVDLAVMAMCDDVIITSGTFGWWGGWLSGGSVVYWNGYPAKGSALDSSINRTDYYPPSWIGKE